MFALCDAIGQQRQRNCHRVSGFFTTMHPVCKSPVAQPAVCNCGVLQTNHPAHSPHVAPSDYCLFINVKSHLRGTQFADNESLEAAVEAWFEEQDRKFFFQGIKQLNRHKPVMQALQQDQVQQGRIGIGIQILTIFVLPESNASVKVDDFCSIAMKSSIHRISSAKLSASKRTFTFVKINTTFQLTISHFLFIRFGYHVRYFTLFTYS